MLLAQISADIILKVVMYWQYFHQHLKAIKFEVVPGQVSKCSQVDAFNFPKQSPAATYQTPILENQRQKRVRLLCTRVHIGFDHLSSQQQFIFHQ